MNREPCHPLKRFIGCRYRKVCHRLTIDVSKRRPRRLLRQCKDPRVQYGRHQSRVLGRYTRHHERSQDVLGIVGTYCAIPPNGVPQWEAIEINQRGPALQVFRGCQMVGAGITVALVWIRSNVPIPEAASRPREIPNLEWMTRSLQGGL